MKKYIFVTNGMAGSGKDTFAKILGEFVTVCKYSSIDKVKGIAVLCGWNGTKSDKDRKFLSDLKDLTSAYSDMAFNSVTKKVNEFLADNLYHVLLIDIREPPEIERVVNMFGAKTVLITSNRVKPVTSNHADAGVYDYSYDYVIENNGTIDEFRNKIQEFACEAIFFDDEA